ncbi:hypothetical protein HAX54_030250, partial [Datura stramonium]|nr:hypothetical protein [Datura stramonium]
AQRFMKPTRRLHLHDTLPSRRGSAPAPSAMVRPFSRPNFSRAFSSMYGFQIRLTNTRIGHLHVKNLQGVTSKMHECIIEQADGRGGEAGHTRSHTTPLPRLKECCIAPLAHCVRRRAAHVYRRVERDTVAPPPPIYMLTEKF